MKTDIQLCVCIALVAVYIASVSSAGSYGGGSYERGVNAGTASFGGGYNRGHSKGYSEGEYSQGYGGGRYTVTVKAMDIILLGVGTGSLYNPYYYLVPYFVGGRRRAGGKNVRDIPAIIARTG